VFSRFLPREWVSFLNQASAACPGNGQRTCRYLKRRIMRKNLTQLMNVVYNTTGEKYSPGHMTGFLLVMVLGIVNLIYYFGVQ
jgi:hypothetical protein